MWSKALEVPESYINWENPGGYLYAFDVKIRDVNGDGKNEILIGDSYFNKQTIAVLDNKAEVKWISERQEAFTVKDGPERFTEFFSTAFLDVADIMPEPGNEIVMLAGGALKIYSSEGELLKESYSKLGFTDLLIDGSTAWLGSSPNGDQTVYKINLQHGQTDDFYNLDRQGLVNNISNNLKTILDQVVDLPNPDASELRKLKFMVYRFNASKEGLRNFQEEVAFFKEKFPYSNIEHIATIKVMEPEPPLDERGKPWSINRWKTDALKGIDSIEEILETARFIEENEIPTFFYIGHSCMPFISLETAEKILQLASNYCLGFRTAEDENLELIPRYFEHFYKPLSDLCIKYGGKVNITKNKGIWWVSSPAMSPVYHAMFEEGRHKVAGSSTEDSNSRTPEMNLMGRSTLWMAGLTQEMVVNLNSDLFSFNRYFQWEYPKHGHPYLRRMIAHTLLGGSIMNIRYLDKMKSDNGYVFNQMGKESTEVFYHLVGKGLVFTPDQDKVRGFSSLGFIMHQAEEKWLVDAYNGHSPEKWIDDPELHNAIIPHVGVPWGMTQTPDHALQKVLMHKDRQFGYNIPATPYGLLAFLPAHAERNKVPGIKEWWHTDGIYLWKEGEEKLTGQAAATALKRSFEDAAQDLLFRYKGDDVFMQVLETGENQFRLYIMDTGWIDPVDRATTILSQKYKIQEVRDVISNEQIKVVDENAFDLKIPAGTFKIIDVTTEKL